MGQTKKREQFGLAWLKVDGLSSKDQGRAVPGSSRTAGKEKPAPGSRLARIF
jgi:hypothetical protein